MLYLKYLITVVIPIALVATLLYRLYLYCKRRRASASFKKGSRLYPEPGTPSSALSARTLLRSLPQSDNPDKAGKYLIIDVQTTGLFDKQRPDTDPPLPLEATLLLADSELSPICSHTSLIYQESIGSPEAVSVHRLSAERVRRYGLPIDALAPVLLRYMERADILVGHNLPFDLAVLRHALPRHEALHTLMEQKEQLCTMALALKKLPEEVSQGRFFSLKQLSRLFGAEWHDKANSAVSYANALYTLFVLKKLS